APADRTRLHVQGDRRPAAPLGEDGREPRLERPAQAPALDTPRARALGDPAPSGLGRLPRVEPEPRGELVELCLDGLRRRPGERHVLVDPVDAEHRGVTVGERVDVFYEEL